MSYLVFLSTFALLFDLLLLLELLGDAGLAERLTFAAFVSFSVEGGFQSGVATHADHDLLTQLQTQRKKVNNDRLVTTG